VTRNVFASSVEGNKNICQSDFSLACRFFLESCPKTVEQHCLYTFCTKASA